MEITATDTNLTLSLTPREVEVVRMALREKQETHKKYGYLNLATEVATLRAKVADALIDKFK